MTSKEKRIMQARSTFHEVDRELRKAGVDESKSHDLATIFLDFVLFKDHAPTVLGVARQGVMRCTDVAGLEGMAKLDNTVHEKFYSVVNNWFPESERWFLEESPLIALAKAEGFTDSEVNTAEELLSGLVDVILEFKRLKEEDDSIRKKMSRGYKELHEYISTLYEGMRNLSNIEEDKNRQKEGIRNLFDQIVKLERAQQSPADSAINEKLDVLSRKVKELENKFGNLKKEVYDVINKENLQNLSAAEERLGVGNAEEVEPANSESSIQESENKSNRLDDAFADFDKQLADLQSILKA